MTSDMPVPCSTTTPSLRQRSQLDVKLDSRRIPVDVLVIEQVRRTRPDK